MSNPAPPASPGTVTLRDIVSVLIRVLAIKFGMSNFGALLANYNKIHEAFYGRGSRAAPLIELAGLAVFFLCAYWLWCLSSFLARHITRGRNSVLPASSFDVLDLYSFAFLFVGLDCIVEGMGPSLTRLHYALMQGSSNGALTLEQKANFYALFNSLTSVIVGLGLTLNARRLATKLLKRQDGARPAME